MKKLLNVWIVNHFASTPNMPGKQRDYQFAKAFSLAGHKVTLWRSSFSHWSRTEMIKDNRPYIADSDGGLNIMHLRTKPHYYKNDYRRFLNMISFARAITKVSQTVSSHPDVIVATYPSPFAAYAACKIAARYNAKFILEIGDLWPQVWIERKAFPRYHPFIVILSAIEKYLHKRTRTFVSSLPYVNDYLKEKGLKSHKFSWIPNGINLDELNTEDEEFNTSGNINEIIMSMIADKKKGKMNVIYVGGIGVGNRIDNIVQSAKILKKRGDQRVSFHIIGDGHSRDAIIKYVSDNNLDSVKMWSPVVRKAVPYLLKNADVGIQCLHSNPIYRYGVNLSKLYDYMAARLPVVFSAEVRNNLVDQYKAGISVPPNDPDSIASALQKFSVMTQEERRDMGMRGYVGIIKDYDINKLSRQYLDLIET
jgi:glycosyltransferase involved in cell wall biosynthesis